MKASPITKLVGVTLEMTAGEARDVYAELYRISSDKLLTSYRTLGYTGIALLMEELGAVGADQ